MRTLVLGGARSGKSAHAEKLLGEAEADYLATARRQFDDPDWEERIAVHVARRPPGWRTVEPSDLPAALRAAGTVPVLVDDVATWLTGELDDAGAWEGGREALAACRARCAELVSAVATYPSRLVLVSAEVGLGVVPATRAGRLFRDELGALNAELAAVCDEVLLLVAGLPVRLRQAQAPGGPAGRMHADGPPRDLLAGSRHQHRDLLAGSRHQHRALQERRVEFPSITPPDQQAHREAVARHEQLTKPAGSLGRLEELGVWVAACQGVCPPRPLAQPQVVVFAGDHGVAARGVSAYPSEVTRQMVRNFLAGGAAVNVLASLAGAAVRVVDMAVDDEPAASSTEGSSVVTRHKVRRSSGAIDRQDALTEAEVTQALTAGIAIADEEVDRGADLLIAGDMGIGNTTVAAVLVAALTGAEPVAVVGRGTGIDDAGWMRKAAAIRDALRRARPVVGDPVALLRTAGGADIAAMAAFLAQAAVRRTPTILDGVAVGAAAMLAEELAPGARQWWVAGHRSVEPAHTLVLEHLELDPILDLGMRLGEGSGAVAALPLLQLAVQILAEMATFDDAGVSGPTGDPVPTR
ncbi:MAG: nicotinate-nucleotide--dimethylbenzimidazole phosphoribosyltransferase [Actinomycetota bacterium]|nr:nicotinate-nucleotide--dimethylbenzimidazole phosphoribosyltransferase [Actinomycetota bacterium]